MYECTNPAPSSFPKPSIRPRETRNFVHSYVLTLTADRRRLVRSACTAAFYLFIWLSLPCVPLHDFGTILVDTLMATDNRSSMG